MNLSGLRRDLNKLRNPKKARILARFFKTGPGEYGEGDVFLGIVVPQTRKIALKYNDLPFSDIQKLLKSKIHEERLAALLILVNRFNGASIAEKEKIVKLYLQSGKYINNWDLVDLSAHKILGEYLLDKPKTILYKLAKSKNIWERRISIIATFSFIKNNLFGDSLKLAKILLQDKHDLIHKAVGWMLREVGKKNLVVEESFLQANYKIMPRTALRYAIERFPEPKRRKYLEGKV